MIQDSGERSEFGSGAVRDMSAGKGRCDLLPMSALEQIFPNDECIRLLTKFMETSDTQYLSLVVHNFSERAYDSIYTSILEVSIHYEEGLNKYGERNWEKGIPCHSFVNSAIRHYFKYLRGDDDERHDRAFVWNILGLMWTIENKPELNDLPYAQLKEL